MYTVECPVWLDKIFLEESLRAGYNDETLSIANYNVRLAIAKGDNYTSIMYRVTMETTRNRTFSVIIKHLLDTGKAGDMVQKSTAYLREKTMLTAVLPKMAALLQNAMLENFEPFGPQHIFSREGLLIMEDLSPLGFKMSKRQEALDLDHCLMVMRKLGRFHATSVLLHQQDPDCMAPFQKNIFIEPNIHECMYDLFSGLINKVADEVETWPESAQFAGKIRAFSKDVMGQIDRLTLRDDKAFNVLNHGDVWVNNLMFKYSNTGEPETVMFVDYQLTHYTSPALDLQYFIHTSPRDEVRMRHTDTLLQEYHGVLCETLKALGYSQKLITLEELRSEYDSKTGLGMLRAFTLLPLVLNESRSGLELNELLDENVSHTAMFRGSTLKSALQRMLPLFDKEGVFRFL